MWVKLDDAILDNSKVLRIGPKGFLLYVSGLVYCGRFLTDGFIPKARLYGIAPWMTPHEIGYFARRLVEVRLWVRLKQGYRVHDYLSYNPSKVDVLRSRRSTAERMKRWRGRRNVTGVSDGVTDSSPAPAPVPEDIKEGGTPPNKTSSSPKPYHQTMAQRAREIEADLYRQFPQLKGGHH